MLDVLEFVFQSFWHWLGTAILLYIVAHYVVNGIVHSLKAIRGSSRS